MLLNYQFSMRRIDDNGYVGLWCPNYAVSNQRYEIRILDATNRPVGSTIEFDFSSDISNKPTNLTLRKMLFGLHCSFKC